MRSPPPSLRLSVQVRPLFAPSGQVASRLLPLESVLESQMATIAATS